MYKEINELLNKINTDVRMSRTDLECSFGDSAYEQAVNSRLNCLMQYGNLLQGILNKYDFKNAPVIHNEVVVGVANTKVENGIECVLWDKFVEVETINGKCSAVIISDKEQHIKQ